VLNDSAGVGDNLTTDLGVDRRSPRIAERVITAQARVITAQASPSEHSPNAACVAEVFAESVVSM
jgi:hypothetical protein